MSYFILTKIAAYFVSVFHLVIQLDPSETFEGLTSTYLCYKKKHGI